jgi:hypothetical protein
MKKNFNEDVQAVNPSLYKNTDFKDKVVGSSTPTKDLINPSLLADVDKAATQAGIKVTITTAVSGHDKGSRHEQGNAVDIAMVNGKGFSGGEQQARSLGIYDGIMKFVNELVNMGYIQNQESGNDKAVLTFGSPGHDNHIHISRKSGGGVSTSTGASTSTTDTKSGDITWNTLLSPLKKGLNTMGINEEVNRFRRLSRVLTESIRYDEFTKPVSYTEITSLSKQIVGLRVEPNSKVVSPYNAEVIEKKQDSIVLTITQKYEQFNITIKNLTNIKVSEGSTLGRGEIIGYTATKKIVIEVDGGDLRRWFKKEEKQKTPTKNDSTIKNIYDKGDIPPIKNVYKKNDDTSIKNIYDKGDIPGIKNIYSKNINEEVEKIKRLLK